MTAARMKVATGRMISMVVSRPPDSVDDHVQEIGRFALADQRDVLREFLQERRGDECGKMFRRHVAEQRQLAHEIDV
jgi:dsDNA-binding SOS-regulon protein